MDAYVDVRKCRELGRKLKHVAGVRAVPELLATIERLADGYAAPSRPDFVRKWKANRAALEALCKWFGVPTAPAAAIVPDQPQEQQNKAAKMSNRRRRVSELFYPRRMQVVSKTDEEGNN